jgi:restriction system protein
MSEPYHWPTELLNLLVDTIPRLVRRKEDVLHFFSAAGVPQRLMADVSQQLRANRTDVNKFAITRTILHRLNQNGDDLLRERREVIRRVCNWEDFSGSWPNDRLEAEGLVARIRAVVGTKDAFTQMKLEKDKVAKEAKEKYTQVAAEKHARASEREKLLRRFSGLFGITAAQQRGKALEQILNDYFKSENLHVRDSFHIVGNSGEGIVEQIDGAIELDGHLFIVEMKWLSEKVGPEPAGYFLSKVFSRSDCGGILIAHPGVTPAAVRHFETALQGKRTVFICTLQEIFGVLNSGDSLTEHLRQRRQRAILDGQPSLE